jgi:uncharacterized membrane protein HdeD (DUF308 family)
VLITNPFSLGAWTREQIDNVSSGWWVLLLSGTISVVAGGIILFTDWSVGDLAAFVGALLVLRGIFTTLSIPLDGSGRAWSVTLGLLEAAVGLAVWIWPGPTLLVVAFWIGWYVLFSGIVAIAGAISGRGILPFWGLTLAFGILEVLFSFWLLARPGLTLVAGVLAIGLWSLVYGVVQIALSFEIHGMSSRSNTADRGVDAVHRGRHFDAAAS